LSGKLVLADDRSFRKSYQERRRMRMRHWRTWLYLVAMIAIFGSCFALEMQNRTPFSRTSKQNEAASQTGKSTETAGTVTQETVVAVVEETAAPTEAPTQTEAAVVEPVNYCVECHTDKDQLIANAKIEEEVPEESEGAG
jgi:mono/diheme cytochrome c family protein